MPVFVTSKTSATVHGAFAIEQTPPTQIAATSTTRVAMVGQFPWGPKDQRFEPGSISEAKNALAPPGFTRTGSAYLMLVGKSFLDLTVVRVLGSSSSAGSVTLPDAVPTNILTWPAKYHGSASGQFTCTVSDATDADPNHFNFTVTVTGASGTTTDKIENFNASAVGVQTVLTDQQLASLLLVGQPTILAAGRPINGTGSFSSGSNGTINAGAYVGTVGTGDKGIALFEGDNAVRFVISDDPGNTIRAAVNAALEAHCALMGDRVTFLVGNSGQSAAAARADALNYSSDRVVYLDPWVYQRDDVTQAETLVSGASFAASLACQTSPSTSIAWKADEQRAKLQGITRLEFDRGLGRGTNTTNGVATWLREETGGHTLEADVVTLAPANPAKKSLTRRRMLDYIAVSFVQSVRGEVDAPNVDLNREDIDTALKNFMGQLKRNQNGDPNHTPFVVDFLVPDLNSANTDVTIAQGDFNIPLAVQFGSAMERIFLLISGSTARIVTSDVPG